MVGKHETRAILLLDTWLTMSSSCQLILRYVPTVASGHVSEVLIKDEVEMTKATLSEEAFKLVQFAPRCLSLVNPATIHAEIGEILLLALKV